MGQRPNRIWKEVKIYINHCILVEAPLDVWEALLHLGIFPLLWWSLLRKFIIIVFNDSRAFLTTFVFQQWLTGRFSGGALLLTLLRWFDDSPAVVTAVGGHHHYSGYYFFFARFSELGRNIWRPRFVICAPGRAQVGRGHRRGGLSSRRIVYVVMGVVLRVAPREDNLVEILVWRLLV